MKQFLLLIAVVSFYTGYSQQYVYNYHDMGIAICEFELAHLDSIEKYSQDTIVSAAIRFSPEGALESVSYYKGSYFSFDADDFKDKQTSVWPGLDAFIKSQYPFMPDTHYNNENGREDLKWLELYLSKEGINNALWIIKHEKKNMDEYWAGVMERYYDHFEIIRPNELFTVTIKKLEINGHKQPLQQVKGVLMYLDSGTVQLSPECYMIFKVLKTSENGIAHAYLEYKLFVVKNGKATLYFKEAMVLINEMDKAVRLKATGNRAYWQDEEGNVLATRGNGYGYMPEEGIKVSEDSFDFEMDITFRRP